MQFTGQNFRVTFEIFPSEAMLVFLTASITPPLILSVLSRRCMVKSIPGKSQQSNISGLSHVSVTLIRSALMASVWNLVRFRRAHFLELQNSCNSKKLYCDMQCKILCLEKLSLIRGNLPNFYLLRHKRKSWATMKSKRSKDDFGWRRLTRIVKDFRIIVSSNDKPRRKMDDQDWRRLQMTTKYKFG